MRNHDLEKMLTQLPSPPAPDSLKGRCLATIPNYAAHNMAISKPAQLRKRSLRFAVTTLALAVLGIMFWSTQNSEQLSSSHGNRGSGGSAAFAQTLDAMRRVNVFHMTGRGRGWSNNAGVVKLEDWQDLEGWTDARHGTYTETHGRSMPPMRSLITPEGTEYLCTHFPDGIVTKDNPPRSYWPPRYSLEISPADKPWKVSEPMLNLLMRLGRPVNNSISGFSFAGDGQWKGVFVAIFKREMPPAKEARNGERPFETRNSVYVDPETHLPVAMQEWGRLPDANNWELTFEAEFNYQQIDQSRFDPRPLVNGADEILRLVGNNWVGVKQSAWDIAHKTHGKRQPHRP
jgi:hypothetical protein